MDAAGTPTRQGAERRRRRLPPMCAVLEAETDCVDCVDE